MVLVLVRNIVVFAVLLRHLGDLLSSIADNVWREVQYTKRQAIAKSLLKGAKSRYAVNFLFAHCVSGARSVALSDLHASITTRGRHSRRGPMTVGNDVVTLPLNLLKTGNVYAMLARLA